MEKQHCFGSREALDESFRPGLMIQPGVTRRVSQRGSEIAVLHDDCSSGEAADAITVVRDDHENLLLFSDCDAGENCQPASEQPKATNLSIKTTAMIRHGLVSWSARARGRAWCVRLGMSRDAWDGWSKMHVNPFIGMAYYFVTAVASLAAKAYFASGMPMERSIYCYILTVPFLLNMTLNAATVCGMWVIGPHLAHKSFPAGILVTVAFFLPAHAAGFVGPLRAVPWGNRFKFVLVESLIFALEQQSTAAGGLPGEHPSEPRVTILPKAMATFLSSVRLMDSLTDASFIRELVHLRMSGCWLFSRPGQCNTWTLLIALFCLFVVIDHVIAVFNTVSAEFMSKSTGRRRVVLICNCVSLVAELGIVAITLVHLCSLQNPANKAREDLSGSQIRSTVALTIVSLATTLLSFVLNIVGFSRLLGAARVAAHRVSAAADALRQNALQAQS